MARIKLDLDREIGMLDALRALQMPVLRWQGGNFVSGYNWTDGLGPRHERPGRNNLAWYDVESNRFGTDEFVEYCRVLGTEPYICANMGTGTMDEAAAWVEYCNGTCDTYWAVILRRNAAPTAVLIFKRFFDGLPKELVEAAIVDSASYFRGYWQIWMPLSGSVIATVSIFTFARLEELHRGAEHGHDDDSRRAGVGAGVLRLAPRGHHGLRGYRRPADRLPLLPAPDRPGHSQHGTRRPGGKRA